jgi:hypothetical protein
VPFHGQTPIPPSYAALGGGRMLLGALLDMPSQLVVPAFAVFGVWFLLRLLFRHALPASIALALLLTMSALGAENPVLEMPNALLSGALTAWLLARYGLLALVASWLMRGLFTMTPLPFSFAAPYAFQSSVGLLLIVLLVGWAFRTSLGGRPVFAFALDD